MACYMASQAVSELWHQVAVAVLITHDWH